MLDRRAELARLRRRFAKPDGGLSVVYGRRRLGKSRLVSEALGAQAAAHYVGDERDATLQRDAVATEMARLVPGLDAVRYPSWDSLLARWWADSPRGAVLSFDEFPAVVATSPELPATLQKWLDRGRRHVVLCGSSQRMMRGLVLDSTAPLYGRAVEMIDLGPLPLACAAEAFGTNPEQTVQRYAMWGGVPRYWELAVDYDDPWEALRELVFDPLGVLHREPERLLRDEVTDLARPASILALIGAGCHRTSEIAARLGVPSTHLGRALALLVELGFVIRDVPFGTPAKDAKRTTYRIADPFLGLWYRFVEPQRSRLATAPIEPVITDVKSAFPHHLGAVWEELARRSVPFLGLHGKTWGPAQRWWGGALAPELDVVAASTDDRHLLVGEVKASCRDVPRALRELAARARLCPALGSRKLHVAVWSLKAREGAVGPDEVVAALAG